MRLLESRRLRVKRPLHHTMEGPAPRRSRSCRSGHFLHVRGSQCRPVEGPASPIIGVACWTLAGAEGSIHWVWPLLVACWRVAVAPRWTGPPFSSSSWTRLCLRRQQGARCTGWFRLAGLKPPPLSGGHPAVSGLRWLWLAVPVLAAPHVGTESAPGTASQPGAPQPPSNP